MTDRPPLPDLSLEAAARRRLGRGARIAGVDEAGRGPWAGPVVAAAVILTGTPPPGLNDSKKLAKSRREALHAAVTASCEFGVGIASVAEIDRINILQASLLAMRRAVAALPAAPALALIDGRQIPSGLPCPAEAVVSGDARALSIAAASIVAKVTRDRIMAELAEEHPEYGWERNAGYGVQAHIDALMQHGVTQHHRRSFAPIHKMLC